MQLKFSILSWGAWSPQYQHADAWQHWREPVSVETAECTAAPKLAQVPAMQRRRLSKLTKMLLEAAFQCEVQPQCRTIFASRHGEINRTIGLLKDLITEDPLSPTNFSQSVHNTASGIYGILTGNQTASTSLAAGSETLSQSLFEAYGQLAQNPEPLLLVYGDEPVPEIYRQFASELKWPIALALVLAPIDCKEKRLARLSISASDESTGSQDLNIGKLLCAIANKGTESGTFSGWHWDIRCD